MNSSLVPNLHTCMHTFKHPGSLWQKSTPLNFERKILFILLLWPLLSSLPSDLKMCPYWDNHAGRHVDRQADRQTLI